jgi:transcriptional regulator GlxA family with amidase domain
LPSCSFPDVPGTSLEFALAVVAELFDEATAQMIAEQMLVPRRYD